MSTGASGAVSSLSDEMISELVVASVESGIDRASLLAGVSPQIVAAIPVGDTSDKGLLHAFRHLNRMRGDGDELHPMQTALTNGKLLSRSRSSGALFDDALARFREPFDRVDPKHDAFRALFTRRMKATYLSFGCRLLAGDEGPPGPFLVEHPDGRTSVVAVFYREEGLDSDLNATIASVLDWLEVARRGGEAADGYVVLAPFARRADRERVLLAQLRPIDYSERRSIDIDTVARVVRCLLGAAPPISARRLSVLQTGDEKAVEESLTSFFRDFHARVWLLLGPRNVDLHAFVQDLFRVAAQSFLQYGLPAPMPLGAAWRARSVTDCASEVFTHNGIPVTPIALEPVLREGMICPILGYEEAGDEVTAPGETALLSRLFEGLSARSKTVVVFPPDEIATARTVERTLASAGWQARIVRALAEPA